MYLPNSTTLENIEEKDPKQVYLNSKEFKHLLFSLQLFFRDHDSQSLNHVKGELIKAFWETTYELYKVTPFHEMLLNYYASYFCINTRIDTKIELLNCINQFRKDSLDINLEWGIKNWVVLINNSNYVYPKEVIDFLLLKARPIIDYYFSHSSKVAFMP